MQTDFMSVQQTLSARWAAVYRPRRHAADESAHLVQLPEALQQVLPHDVCVLLQPLLLQSHRVLTGCN